MVVLNNLKVYTIPNRLSSFLVGGKYTAYILTVTVASSLTYQINYEALTSSTEVLNAFKTSLINSLSSSLGVDPSTITITSVTSGSVVANYTIITTNYTDATNLSANIQTQSTNTNSSLAQALVNIAVPGSLLATAVNTAIAQGVPGITSDFINTFPTDPPSIISPIIKVDGSVFSGFSSNVTNFNPTSGTYNYALNWKNPSLPLVLPQLSISSSPAGLFNFNSNLYSNTSNFTSNLPAVPYGQSSNYIITLNDLYIANNTTPYTITILGSNYPQGGITIITPSSITYCNVTILGTTNNYPISLDRSKCTLVIQPNNTGTTYTSNITLPQFTSGIYFSNLQSSTPYTAIFSITDASYGNTTLSNTFLTYTRSNIYTLSNIGTISYNSLSLQLTENYPDLDPFVLNIYNMSNLSTPLITCNLLSPGNANIYTFTSNILESSTSYNAYATISVADSNFGPCNLSSGNFEIPAKGSLSNVSVTNITYNGVTVTYSFGGGYTTSTPATIVISTNPNGSSPILTSITNTTLNASTYSWSGLSSLSTSTDYYAVVLANSTVNGNLTIASATPFRFPTQGALSSISTKSGSLTYNKATITWTSAGYITGSNTLLITSTTSGLGGATSVDISQGATGADLTFSQPNVEYPLVFQVNTTNATTYGQLTSNSQLTVIPLAKGMISSITPSSVTYCNVTVLGTTYNYPSSLDKSQCTLVIQPNNTGTTYTSNITLQQFTSGVYFSNLQSSTPYTATLSITDSNYGNSTLSNTFLTYTRSNIYTLSNIGTISYNSLSLQLTENYPDLDPFILNIYNVNNLSTPLITCNLLSPGNANIYTFTSNILESTTPYIAYATISVADSNFGPCNLSSGNFQIPAKGSLSNVSVTNITYQSATINWGSNNYSSNTQLTITGTPGQLTSNTVVGALSYNLSNLTPSTTYSLNLTANSTIYGNCNIALQPFTTARQGIITLFSAINSNYSNVTLQWAENYPASDSCTISIFSNANNNLITSSNLTSIAANNCNLTLSSSNLISSIGYSAYAIISVTDPIYGNCNLKTTQNFTIPGQGVIIAQPTSNVNYNSVKINWGSNNYSSNTPLIITGTPGPIVGSNTVVGALSYNLSNLTPSTSYILTLTANSAFYGNCNIVLQSFTTLSMNTYVTTNLVAYWDLTNSTATNGTVLTMIQDTISGYNLIYNANGTTNSPLQLSKSPNRIVFPSTLAYYNVPYTLSLTNGFSFEFLCLITPNATGFTPVSIFWTDYNNNRIMLTYLTTTSVWGSQGWMLSTASSQGISVSSDLSIVNGTTYYHIVVTLSSTGNCCVYVNGSLKGSVSSPLPGTGAGYIAIGTYALTNAYNQVGAFVMARAYNKVLTQSEVTQNYIATKGNSNNIYQLP